MRLFMRCEDVGMGSSIVRHGPVVGSWERNELRLPEKEMMEFMAVSEYQPLKTGTVPWRIRLYPTVK